MPTFSKDWRPYRTDAHLRQLADRAGELRSALQTRDPDEIAARSAVHFITHDAGHGELQIPFWEIDCRLSWPALRSCEKGGDSLSEFQLTLLLYYLITADGEPLKDTWVSFADLPDGRIYNSAFQGYTGDELVKAFGLNLNSFKKACISVGGSPIVMGDASFTFHALPRLPMMVTYWLGDEDFPSSCKILFDQSACHYLPVDGCAILGSSLVRKLLQYIYRASHK